MAIKRIRLKNFKNFRDETIELGSMNVLVGTNASGKSNFLDALRFLRDIQEDGLENAISLRAGMEHIMNMSASEDENLRIELELLSEYDELARNMEI